jgi:hypothetical protein
LSPGDDLAVRDHDCANGNLTRSRSKLRLVQRGLHKDFVLHRVYVTDPDYSSGVSNRAFVPVCMELFKTTKMYDGDEGRQQQHFRWQPSCLFNNKLQVHPAGVGA